MMPCSLHPGPARAVPGGELRHRGNHASVRADVLSFPEWKRPTAAAGALQPVTTRGTGSRRRQFQGPTSSSNGCCSGRIKEGLIWHFQGSGKSLLMVFTALQHRAMVGCALRRHAKRRRVAACRASDGRAIRFDAMLDSLLR